MESARINYAVGAGNVPVVYSYGMPPAHGGFFTTYIRYVVPYPLYSEPGHEVENATQKVLERIRSSAVNALRASKSVLGDMNATSDLLRLLINGVKLIGESYELKKTRLLARAFSQITEFNSARSWMSRSYDILSGEAANKEPINGRWNFLSVASESLFLVTDVSETTEWLSSIGMLGDIVAKEMATIQAFGYTLVVTFSKIASVATVLGTIPNLIDNIRLVVKYYYVRTDMLEGERHFKLKCYSLECASDICRIASCVLFSMPGPGFTFLGVVVSTIGTCISLWKFYCTESTKIAREKENEEYISRKEAVLQVCEQYLQISTHELGRQNIDNLALNEVKAALRTYDEDNKSYLLQNRVDAIVLKLLKKAEKKTRNDADHTAHDQVQKAIERIQEYLRREP